MSSEVVCTEEHLHKSAFGCRCLNSSLLRGDKLDGLVLSSCLGERLSEV